MAHRGSRNDDPDDRENRPPDQASNQQEIIDERLPLGGFAELGVEAGDLRLNQGRQCGLQPFGGAIERVHRRIAFGRALGDEGGGHGASRRAIRVKRLADVVEALEGVGIVIARGDFAKPSQALVHRLAAGFRIAEFFGHFLGLAGGGDVPALPSAASGHADLPLSPGEAIPTTRQRHCVTE